MNKILQIVDNFFKHSLQIPLLALFQIQDYSNDFEILKDSS